MGNPMKIRASAKDGVTEIKVLMSHEMETGQRKDASGTVIPAWFINEVTAKLDGKTVMQAQWGPSISKNPYLAFKVKGGKAGDKVSVTWVDSKGDTRTDEATVT
ncbi:sulfur compound chelating protein SoxZ [Azospirillum oryzae]|jgi:sulfur-oxidizing protein SoxZ|uniref:Sulfur compound chelating protein SoxZ n=1 Tax=Azospirillum oryzae TaxID=286727 RepID=A0A1X7DKD5_9PROT|nr:MULTISPECIES: thiosulfate oxidation carrier complex protein SoxZ [Azospirillum]MCM8737908.1 thiosulfate oxidation carrier complex protein SoxZ [Azospirillum sp. A1-3]PWC60591.1 thiosulfate oxidation carrier complex protein SoxZ [Azospirillum sp. TSH7]PWC60658.1 thiosulfate oxidation carrier complex protein SoxZ [Azospirillum sp. TSH20]QCG93566.1 thiosulfate oxidation carrier complex protein SoxZ [Azospirillum sp. TSA2s]SMF17058.1 sulfur compound chelating protein SoxZ [Azospirillum oryzae]